MLRLLGLVCVTAGLASAKPPLPPVVGKEQAPMDRDHYAPDRTPEKPDLPPAAPAPRPAKPGVDAGIKFPPLMPRPLGLAPVPGSLAR